jgi:hypothetical protein
MKHWVLSLALKKIKGSFSNGQECSVLGCTLGYKTILRQDSFKSE